MPHIKDDNKTSGSALVANLNDVLTNMAKSCILRLAIYSNIYLNIDLSCATFGLFPNMDLF